MIENVPLFDLYNPAEATAQQLLDAFNNGIDPRTGKDDDALSDELGDIKYMWRNREETPLGTFERVAEWNGGDGREQGRVVKHVESGLLFMSTSTYSSWDASDWDEWVQAKPYEFTETRYRAV